VLTKADKLSEKDLGGVLEATARFIVKRPAAHPEIILTSSEKGLGIDTLRQEVARLREGL
ncbi:MAG TPA: YihA family ribosome biogenesis GTP-binding protein, partial [Pelagibacterium sp.]|nr:YihA family ribosome biogenesis GTP-binding protein [Pelagibacterium sp.]